MIYHQIYRAWRGEPEPEGLDASAPRRNAADPDGVTAGDY
jgi:hypothetical protein